MKNVKTIIALVLVLAMAACLCACAPAVTEKDVAAAAEALTDAVEEAVSDGEAKGDGNDKILSMGTNAEFPPYEFYDGDAIVGIDAEIAGAIAEKLGMELVINDMVFDSVIPAITSGKIDIGMAGMTVTEERKQSVNFSESYATGVQVVIVKDGGTITNMDDLFAGGVTVGVQTATTGDLYSTWDIEDEGLGTVQRYNKGADAVAALVAGKIDCVIIDNEPAKAFVAANQGLSILDTEYAVEEYAIAMALDNTELQEQINAALVELTADGTIQAILNKYIG